MGTIDLLLGELLYSTEFFHKVKTQARLSSSPEVELALPGTPMQSKADPTPQPIVVPTLSSKPSETIQENYIEPPIKPMHVATNIEYSTVYVYNQTILVLHFRYSFTQIQCDDDKSDDDRDCDQAILSVINHSDSIIRVFSY